MLLYPGFCVLLSACTGAASALWCISETNSAGNKSNKKTLAFGDITFCYTMSAYNSATAAISHSGLMLMRLEEIF